MATAQAAPVHSIQVGDMALFYFANLGRIGHIGIVTGLLKNGEGAVVGVRTMEGNTTANAGAVVREGGTGGVFAKAYNWSETSGRCGFARLPFYPQKKPRSIRRYNAGIAAPNGRDVNLKITKSTHGF